MEEIIRLSPGDRVEARIWRKRSNNQEEVPPTYSMGTVVGIGCASKQPSRSFYNVQLDDETIMLFFWRDLRPLTAIELLYEATTSKETK